MCATQRVTVGQTPTLPLGGYRVEFSKPAGPDGVHLKGTATIPLDT